MTQTNPTTIVGTDYPLRIKYEDGIDRSKGWRKEKSGKYRKGKQ